MLTLDRLHKLSIGLLFATISSAFAGTTQEDLAAASSKWQAAALKSYEYTVEDTPSVPTSCDHGLPAKLRVHDGRVTRGFYLKEISGKNAKVRISESCLKFLYTIDSLFAYVAERVGHCQTLQVSFDARYGYPTEVIDECILDGNFPVRIWDVVPARE